MIGFLIDPPRRERGFFIARDLWRYRLPRKLVLKQDYLVGLLLKILTTFAAFFLLYSPDAYAGSSDDYAYAKGLQICLLVFGRNQNVADAALGHFKAIYGFKIFVAFAIYPSMEDRIIKKIEEMGCCGEWVKLVEQV